jgi:hypothetical protein
VKSFGGLPIYGLAFIDSEEPFTEVSGALSLDWRSGDCASAHSLSLFQETFSPDRILEIGVWCERLTIRNADNVKLDVAEVVESGRRWWLAL